MSNKWDTIKILHQVMPYVKTYINFYVNHINYVLTFFNIAQITKLLTKQIA